MADTFKFPNNGYEVTVVRKQDILNCIDSNIIDKEVALAIVEQCERDAANFINEGKWTGLPYMGNVRVPQNVQMLKSEEQQALIKEARETLDKDNYILFKTELERNNSEKIRARRYYNYIVSIAVNSNKKLYSKLCKDKSECYAKIFLYACRHITAINNEDININND